MVNKKGKILIYHTVEERSNLHEETLARRQLFTLTLLHKESIFHEDSFALVEKCFNFFLLSLFTLNLTLDRYLSFYLIIFLLIFMFSFFV